MSKNEHFDLCIIGAGSAGLSLAAGAAQLGLKTALVEKSKMGGDCLNTGCVPSKALLKASKVAQSFRNSSKFGIENQEPKIDFSEVKNHVSQVIKAIEPNDSVERFEGFGVNVIKGAAKFTGPDSVKVNDREITARYFCISTGSSARVLKIDGLEEDKVYTNENIFELKEKPKHLLIIGGGPIGIEMAQAHRRLGSKVSVIDAGKILSKDDPELVSILRKKLIEEEVTLFEKNNIVKVSHSGKEQSITIESGGKETTLKGSHILVAAGRVPNINTLDLKKANVEYSPRGIKVNKRLKTTNKNIYAAGDVAGGPQFTHVAGYHAGIIIQNICFKIPKKVNYKALPWVTYTDPEISNTGMTEAMAIKKYGKDKIKTISWEFEENDRAQAERRTEGMIKVTLTKRGKILGATIIGPSAGELINIWSLAISKGMKIGSVASIIVPYPTLGEISKRAAGSWFTPSLFSDKTKSVVRFLQKLPF